MAGWRQIPLSAVVVHGISPIRKLCVLRFRMPFSVTVVFLRCSVSVRQTFRTAVYGPVRTVVWQGRWATTAPMPIDVAGVGNGIFTEDLRASARPYRDAHDRKTRRQR